MKTRPTILITNDDGIYAGGIMALVRTLKPDYEVHVVAPEAEMSAVGHAITLSSPLRVHKVEKEGAFFGYAVVGTPADCVKIAIQELLPRVPDVVLSGINLGANLGVNVLYSGTVSAATEGAFLGVPSAAISLATLKDPDFSYAAEFSRSLVRFMLDKGVKKGTALNVNIPAVSADKIRGICFTRQGTARFEEHFERRTDPRGKVYYWLTGETPVENGGSDTDSAALRGNKVSITPIFYDLTCHDELARLQAGCRSSLFS
jgi:5'-nucleotidase